MTNLLFLVACGGGIGSDYGDAILPTEDQVRINMPIASEAAKSPDDLEGWAMYYEATRNVTEHVNGLIAGVLGSVWLVVHTQEPSYVNDEQTKAMWGPYSDSGLDPVETGVYVEKLEDGSFAWAVFQVPNGGTVETDAVEIVVGAVDAGSTRDDATGRFVIDFETAATLDPAVNLVGQFAVEYAYDAEGVAAVASTEGYGYESGPRWTAVYAYDEDYLGAGEMDLAYAADLNASGTNEIVTLKSRWQDDGMGRGDSQVLEGDLAADFTGSECWGSDFKTSYWTDSHGIYADVGEESVCAFTPASYADEASFAIEE